ncbi:unnamed protein product, partial [Tetraodon nigroviridis]
YIAGQCLCFGVDHSALDNSCQPGRLLHAQSPVRSFLMVVELHYFLGPPLCETFYR